MKPTDDPVDRAIRAAAARGAAVPSPCLSICRMDPASGLCKGCSRTIEEIAGWSTLDNAGRLAVWDRIAARRGASSA